jgi:transcriptional regulator GlxA family with amidase domain
VGTRRRCALTAKRLNVVDVDDLVEARGIADALQAAADQRLTLQRGFALFRRLGAPVNLSVDALHGAPDDRDRRLARAMEEQLTHLATRATTLHLGDTAALSPRHTQRLVREFNARHGLNAGNWRDTRNRWRLQTAALLLSCPQVPITDVAKEVGYASVHALARAFATVGFPTPGALRRRVGGA